MQDIEPFYLWKDYYDAADDKFSPFYGREYSEFHFSNKIYNYYIHPQWDFFGSSTLYCKLLFADYEEGYAIVEFIGEWNDAVHNDIMEIKRTLADPLIEKGINRFILIAENVLNFHASDDLYYEEWFEDVKDAGGWIAIFNLREHILEEMQEVHLSNYLSIGERFNHILWRKFKPADILNLTENLILKALG